jgi:hypothetical protein
MEGTRLDEFLKRPALLQVRDEEGTILYGCDQTWYPSYWKRLSGCGPSTASNLVLYLQRRGVIGTTIAVSDKRSFVDLMELMWKYVTPRYQGVHLLSQFYRGVDQYLVGIGSKLPYTFLEIPKERSARPSLAKTVGFIVEALARDVPVAFLNLSRGNLKNLDEWHWVTVVGIRWNEPSDSYLAMIHDASRQWEIDIGQWYRTTNRGGGFIAFYPEESPK